MNDLKDYFYVHIGVPPWRCLWTFQYNKQPCDWTRTECRKHELSKWMYGTVLREFETTIHNWKLDTITENRLVVSPRLPSGESLNTGSLVFWLIIRWSGCSRSIANQKQQNEKKKQMPEWNARVFVEFRSFFGYEGRIIQFTKVQYTQVNVSCLSLWSANPWHQYRFSGV